MAKDITPEEIETTTTEEVVPEASELDAYYFPEYDKSVEASSLEEATKLVVENQVNG